MAPKHYRLFSKYRLLSQEDLKGDDSEKDERVFAPQPRSSRLFIQLLPWFLCLLFASLYATSIYHPLRDPYHEGFGNELGAPIIYEDRTYLSNTDGDNFDIYSQDNPDVDEIWRSIRMDKMTAITVEEYSRVSPSKQTAHLYGGEEGYGVLLEVFHQLHCLDAIRQEFYASPNETVVTKGFAEGGHADHCFSYLVQTILCHGDVGFMTVRWHEKMQAFHANFNVQKKCRNVDAIREWALAKEPMFHPTSRSSR